MRLPNFTLTTLSKALLPFGLFMFGALPVFAHELWIAPESYQIPSQTRLVAGIVNGQDFSGHALPYLPRVAVRMDNVVGDSISAIEARAGDRPAIDIETPPEGLNVIVYQAASASLTYHDAEKFWSFVDHKDLGVTMQQHQARGLPDAEFKEIYSRYSKALVAVGAGTGFDQHTGMPTEIVALNNPYTDDMAGGFLVQLWYGDRPREDTQIEVFAMDSAGKVTASTLRTGLEGIATIQVLPGHTYMLDAVVLREPTPELMAETGAVYESLWANMTFAVPAKD